MSVWKRINELIFPGTKGIIALSHFLISAISGILLAIPYNVANAGNSVIEMMLYKPQASFIRNIHYWSAQLFLLFTLLHIYSQFKQKGEKNVHFPVWIRLSISILFVFYLLLSGFIIKGDVDGLQAHRILSNLLLSIPLAGKSLALFFTGKEGSLLLMYVHHISTATLILIIIIYEHSRNIWANLKSFSTSLLLVCLLSIFITAPFHDGINPVLKGPWYFTGLQEFLHSLKYPFYAILVLVFIILIIIVIPKLKGIYYKIAIKLLIVMTLLISILTIKGFYLRGENWQVIYPWQKHYMRVIYFPSFTFLNPFQKVECISYKISKKESCLICHDKMEGFSISHEGSQIGCVVCHLGNPYLLGKKEAHRNMIKIPGNLDNAMLTCGSASCHKEICKRMEMNIMTTNSGIISVDKFAFNEQKSTSEFHHVSALKKSKVDIHLKNLCIQCHLGKEKSNYGPLTPMQTGGGCLACHLNYSKKNNTELSQYYGLNAVKKDHLTKEHPSLTIKKGNEICFACHSRSGRISLSYEGWYESLLNVHEVQNNKNIRIIEDGRVLFFHGADLHHQASMLCIDCHNSFELMGDGKKHIHKEDQVQIICSDCHQNKPYNTKKASEIDKESALIASLRGIKSTHYLINSKSGKPIINTFTNGKDSAFLIGKQSGKIHYLKAPSKVCSTNSHKNVACEMCHTPVVSACIGCHNSFNKNQKGINNNNGKTTKGQWTEYAGEFILSAPSAGVSTKNNQRKIVACMPGMIMSVKEENNKDSFFKRLYAPANPHNTEKPALNCKKCHNNPQTLCYGKGVFEFTISEKKLYIQFKPYYQNSSWDNLAADAWTGFLQQPTKPNATRDYLRPLNINEQKRMLLVSSCLHCHDDNSSVMQESLIDFNKLLLKRVNNCYPLVFISTN